MDQTIKDAIECRMREVWEDCIPEEKLDETIVHFMEMIEFVDEDPEVMIKTYDVNCKKARLDYRNKMAEEGTEMTPEEVDFVFNLYQIAISVSGTET
jgi:hypothetical protein